MKKLLLFLVLLFVITGCAQKELKEDGKKLTKAEETQAEDHYNERCASCHGKDLEGANAPTLKGIGAKYGVGEIKDIIINGKGKMPGGLFKGEDADNLAEWLSNMN
jgi:cytochrome c551